MAGQSRRPRKNPKVAAVRSLSSSGSLCSSSAHRGRSKSYSAQDVKVIQYICKRCKAMKTVKVQKPSIPKRAKAETPPPKMKTKQRGVSRDDSRRVSYSPRRHVSHSPRPALETDRSLSSAQLSVPPPTFEPSRPLAAASQSKHLPYPLSANHSPTQLHSPHRSPGFAPQPLQQRPQPLQQRPQPLQQHPQPLQQHPVSPYSALAKFPVSQPVAPPAFPSHPPTAYPPPAANFSRSPGPPNVNYTPQTNYTQSPGGPVVDGVPSAVKNWVDAEYFTPKANPATSPGRQPLLIKERGAPSISTSTALGTPRHPDVKINRGALPAAIAKWIAAYPTTAKAATKIVVTPVSGGQKVPNAAAAHEHQSVVPRGQSGASAMRMQSPQGSSTTGIHHMPRGISRNESIPNPSPKKQKGLCACDCRGADADMSNKVRRGFSSVSSKMAGRSSSSQGNALGSKHVDEPLWTERGEAVYDRGNSRSTSAATPTAEVAMHQQRKLWEREVFYLGPDPRKKNLAQSRAALQVW